MDSQIKKIFVCLGIFLFLFSVQAQRKDENQKEIRLVLSIMDARGRYAGGLKAEDIKVVVDKKQQDIASFTDQNQPATIVFLIDISRSEEGKVAALVKEIGRFIRNSNSSNEYIVLAFNTKIQRVYNKTNDFRGIEEALNRISATKPKGGTALFDSAYAAIEIAESGKYQRKILIVCSDGKDNQSVSYKIDDVTEFLKKSDVLFYGVSKINAPAINAPDIGDLTGNGTLTSLAQISGGQSFFPITEAETSGVFDRIALELKSQYQIGFRVADFTKPDKWQTVKIKVAPVLDGNKRIKVQARTRNGFYPASAK